MESARLCNSNRLKPTQTQVAYDESFLGPEAGSVVNEINRHPVLEHQAGKCKFLRTCSLAVKGA